MDYVVFNKDTTVLLNRQSYATESTAKAARTRAANAGKIKAADYLIAEVNEFYNNIEKKVVRVNLMTGKEYLEAVNTPSFCSPAYEAYWST